MQTVFRTFGLLLFCGLILSGCIDETVQEVYSYGKYTDLGSMDIFPGTLIQEGGFSVPLGHDKTLWLTGKVGVEAGASSLFSFHGHAAGIADRGVVPTGGAIEWLMNEDGTPIQIFPMTPSEAAYNADTTNYYRYQIVPTGGIQVGDSTYIYGTIQRISRSSGMSDDRKLVLCALDADLKSTRKTFDGETIWQNRRVSPVEKDGYLYLFVQNNGIACYRTEIATLRNINGYLTYAGQDYWASSHNSPFPVIEGSNVEVTYSRYFGKLLGLSHVSTGPVLGIFLSENPDTIWQEFPDHLYEQRSTDFTSQLRLHPDLFRDNDRTIVLSYLAQPRESGFVRRHFAEFTFHEE